MKVALVTALGSKVCLAFIDKNQTPCLILICCSKKQAVFQTSRHVVDDSDDTTWVKSQLANIHSVPEGDVNEPAIAVEGQAAFYFYLAVLKDPTDIEITLA